MPSLPGPIDGLWRTVTRPLETATRPMGSAMRYRPLYPLNAVDRLVNGSRTLEKAVRGKYILVTGASSGIGEQAARQVAAAGGTVLLVARGQEKLEELQQDIQDQGGTAHVYPADLTDYDAIDGMMEKVLAQHGQVDVLVNNAGRSIRRSLSLSYDRFHDFERTMQLNYFAPLRLILRVMPGMRERQSGHIINMSSIGVQTRPPRFGAYIASKAALDTLCDAVQGEVQDDGVRFTTIYMGLVRTPMIAPTSIYKRFPTLSPEQAGAIVCDAITFKPRRLSPPVGSMASFADAISPMIMDTVRNQAYHLFPDSKAAKGDKSADGKKAPTTEQEPGVAGRVFAQATRGVHW